MIELVIPVALVVIALAAVALRRISEAIPEVRKAHRGAWAMGTRRPLSAARPEARRASAR